jgi:hypothetical protein
MSHPPWYTRHMIMTDNNRPTYTLWNGVQLINTYPHTREGMDAAMERAMELGMGAKLYSSRDDLVWSADMVMNDLMCCE